MYAHVISFAHSRIPEGFVDALMRGEIGLLIRILHERSFSRFWLVSAWQPHDNSPLPDKLANATVVFSLGDPCGAWADLASHCQWSAPNGRRGRRVRQGIVPNGKSSRPRRP